MSGPPHVRLSRGGSWGVRRLQSPMHARGMFTDSARPFAGVLATKRAYLRSRCHSLGTRPWPVSVPLVLLGFACDFRRATESSPYWSSAAGFVRPACVSECRHPSGSWADSILHVQSIRDLKELVLFCFGGCSPATQTRCHGVAGSASVVSKKNSQYRRKLLESLRNFFSFFLWTPFSASRRFRNKRKPCARVRVRMQYPCQSIFTFLLAPPCQVCPVWLRWRYGTHPRIFEPHSGRPPSTGAVYAHGSLRRVGQGRCASRGGRPPCGGGSSQPGPACRGPPCARRPRGRGHRSRRRPHGRGRSRNPRARGSRIACRMRPRGDRRP